MKIAICGAGLVGSYTYRILSRAGYNNITLFDTAEPPSTNCGINPCAWGTSVGFKELIAYAGIEPEKYIFREYASITINQVKVKASALVFDKPKLIADLRNGALIQRSPPVLGEFERVIDATGSARAYLPAIAGDLKVKCTQFRAYAAEPLDFGIHISNMGYAWCFPLANNECHVGAGSLIISPRQMLENLGWLSKDGYRCACAAPIRITAPFYARQFVHTIGNTAVWGVGEAIGCVAPLAGEGIIPGLKSARLLLNHWEDPAAYEKAILKEFEWMKEERKVIDKIRHGKRIGLMDARIFKSTTQRLNMEVGVYQALNVLRHLTSKS